MRSTGQKVSNPNNNEPPRGVKIFLMVFATVAILVLVTLIAISPELQQIIIGSIWIIITVVGVIAFFAIVGVVVFFRGDPPRL